MTAAKQVKQAIVYRELSHLQEMFRDLLSELGENSITFPVQPKVKLPVRLAAEGDDLVVELGSCFEKVFDLAEGRTALWEATQFAVNVLTGQHRVLVYGRPEEPQKVLVETQFDDTWLTIDRWHRRTGAKRASLEAKFRNAAEPRPVQITLDEALLEELAYLDEYFEMDEDVAGDYFVRRLDDIAVSATAEDLPFLRSMLGHPNFWVREAAACKAVELGGLSVLPELVRAEELWHAMANELVMASQLYNAVADLAEMHRDEMRKQLRRMRAGKGKATRMAIDAILLNSALFEEEEPQAPGSGSGLTHQEILGAPPAKSSSVTRPVTVKLNLLQ